MGKITTVASCNVSRKVIQKILVHPQPIVAIAVKHIEHATSGAIVLVSVATYDSNVYIFDMRSCPAIMHEGQLWRLLQAEDLVKVMHDCRHASAAFKKEFGIKLKNVFDTQAAYCVMMIQRELPPRLLHRYHLYEKFGDVDQRYLTRLQYKTDGTGMYWAKRPMSNDLIRASAVDAMALVPAVYENLKTALSPASEQLVNELCYAYINGKFKRPQDQHHADSLSPRRHTVRLTEDQQDLLKGTLPQATGSLSY